MVNAQLYRMFLRRNVKLSLSVSLGGALVSYALVVLFPGMDPRTAQTISATWPSMMKDLFGDPAQAFADVYGWISLEVYHITFWALFGAIAAILASRIIARERENKTLEILLSYPVSRSSVVISRSLALTTLLVIAVVPCVLALGLGIMTLGLKLEAGVLLFASLAGLFLSLFCAAVSLLASAAGAGQTLSTFISLAVTFFMFLFTANLAKLVPSLSAVAFMSPFHAYRVDEILIGGVLDPSLFLLPIYAVVPAGVAVQVFARRDILL
jgi:ABC-2 type transport system permease protein